MRKGELTRQAILDQATEVASRVGLGGLTIGQLAAHTEMSKSGLFAHFQSKESLQLQVLEWAHDRYVDLVVRPALSTPRGERRLRVLFDRWLVWATEILPGGCIFTSASFELDDQPGPVRDALVRYERDLLELIATVAGTAVGEGEYRADVDTEQFAYEMHGIVLAYHHASRLLADPAAAERARRAFESLVAAARAGD
ncbi:MAG: TetR family transcriptional regulator [Propionibacteriales bacterium]|nr:TetR family transcriptional regulator [Propionibacteriales bacterium]